MVGTAARPAWVDVTRDWAEVEEMVLFGGEKLRDDCGAAEGASSMLPGCVLFRWYRYLDRKDVHIFKELYCNETKVGGLVYSKV